MYLILIIVVMLNIMSVWCHKMQQNRSRIFFYVSIASSIRCALINDINCIAINYKLKAYLFSHFSLNYIFLQILGIKWKLIAKDIV